MVKIIFFLQMLFCIIFYIFLSKLNVTYFPLFGYFLYALVFIFGVFYSLALGDKIFVVSDYVFLNRNRITGKLAFAYILTNILAFPIFISSDNIEINLRNIIEFSLYFIGGSWFIPLILAGLIRALYLFFTKR